MMKRKYTTAGLGMSMPPGLFHTRTSMRIMNNRRKAGVIFFEQPSRQSGDDRIDRRRPSAADTWSPSPDLQLLLDKEDDLKHKLIKADPQILVHTPTKTQKDDTGNISLLDDDGGEEEGGGCRSFMQNCYVKFGLRHVIPLIILAAYSLLGAALFYALEVHIGKEMWGEIKGRVNTARRIVYERMWELHELNLTRDRTIIYATEAINWYEEQVAEERIASGKAIWDFWSAIFYCATIYTTIGYGTIVPITVAGKVLTMLYSIVGIPLVFSILNDFGEFFSKLLFKFWMWATKSCFLLHGCQVPEDISDEDGVVGSEPEPSIMERLHDLPMSVAFGVTLLWMLLCAALFCTWETDWGYFTAFYFFFVSLTTIGLGDTVPKHLNYMILNFWCVLVGLSLVSMCIQVAQAKVEHLVQEILYGISKKYQEVQVQGEDSMPELDLERTMHQHPPWMRALIGKNKVDRIKTEWSKKAAMRAKSTQTDCVRASISMQTEGLTDWSKVYNEQRARLTNALTNVDDLDREVKCQNTVIDRYEQALHTLFNYSKMEAEKMMTPEPQQGAIHDVGLVSPDTPLSPSVTHDQLQHRKAVLQTVQTLLADTPMCEVVTLPALLADKVPPSYSDVLLNDRRANRQPAQLSVKHFYGNMPAFETKRRAPLSGPLDDGTSLLTEAQIRINECRRILSDR